jgi:hypothetical protein
MFPTTEGTLQNFSGTIQAVFSRVKVLGTAVKLPARSQEDIISTAHAKQIKTNASRHRAHKIFFAFED